ncbi:hypothetical protein OG696_26130 [Streptomyces sp. NBC_00656]|uniref:hypothetical protein n=1 Tax=Streptomyces sp. NBC_00656 TaxID=2903668 RepID=UPI003247E3E4
MARPQNGVGDQHLRLRVDVLELKTGGLNGAVRVQRVPGPQGMDVFHHQNSIAARGGVQSDVGLPSPLQVPLSLFDMVFGLLGLLLKLELLEPGPRAHPCGGDGRQQRAGHTDRRHQQCYDTGVHLSPASKIPVARHVP